MYVDKLDGRITADFDDRKAAEWRTEHERLLTRSAGWFVGKELAPLRSGV